MNEDTRGNVGPRLLARIGGGRTFMLFALLATGLVLATPGGLEAILVGPLPLPPL